MRLNFDVRRNSAEMRRNLCSPSRKIGVRGSRFPCATKFSKKQLFVHVLLYNGKLLPQHIQKTHQTSTCSCNRLNAAMTRPNPLVEPRSFNSSTREVMFFNPALIPPSALTPGLTPFPDSKSPAFNNAGKRPWVVSPPPPTGLKSKLGEAGGASSSCGCFKRDASGRGPCSMALAFLLGAVLIVVALGAYVLLVYLAITTQKPKYIAFSSCLGGLFLLIACNILSSGEPGGEVRPGGRTRTESEDDEEVLRAYGLKR